MEEREKDKQLNESSFNEVITNDIIKGKKKSIKQTPLEKEMRLFNKMIAEITALELEQKNIKQEEDLFTRLYHTQLLPMIMQLYKDRMQLYQHLNEIFITGQYKKAEQQIFAEFMLEELDEISGYVSIEPLYSYYFNLNVSLMSKKQKQKFEEIMLNEFDEEEIEMDNFDAESFFKSQQTKNASGAFNHEQQEGEEEFDFFKAPSKTPHPNENNPEEIELKALYKELAKIIHPDLEADDSKRLEKQTLMQQLVEARKEHNLFMMLMIKIKAHEISGTIINSAYSIEKLKLYNQQLKRKLSQLRYQLESMNLKDMYIHRGKFVVQKISAEEKIKDNLKMVKHDMKKIQKQKAQIDSHDKLSIFIAHL